MTVYADAWHTALPSYRSRCDEFRELLTAALELHRQRLLGSPAHPHLRSRSVYRAAEVANLVRVLLRLRIEYGASDRLHPLLGVEVPRDPDHQSRLPAVA